MPSITYDGRSFMLDGRRIWIVSGTVQYARIPKEQWADRIHAAKLAGLNTIDTPVLWNRHEPLPGQFDFEGDNDIRHFVRLIGEAGLHCIIRPGPYNGANWDFGGLPNWLRTIDGIQFRTANGPFLEACSRYITALADQIRDLQVSSPGKGGPILLVQNESEWTCGNDALGHAYLGELNRYLRESGINVPTINSNNLWAGVESEIDAWSGSAGMLATMRQLAEVRPDLPRLVIDFQVARHRTWGNGGGAAPSPAALQRRLAEVLAGGGQYNINPFHGGTAHAFFAGRLADGPASFVTPTDEGRAPLEESGAPGPAFGPVRRLSTFASRFAKVLANLDPDYRPVMSDPGQIESAPAKTRRYFVSHRTGAQGDVAFVFADDPATARAKTSIVTLLLDNGTELEVPIGSQSVAWCLFDVLLNGRARLDYTNLNALAAPGSLFVCFGPAGAAGVVSINGSPLEVTVPKARSPVIVEHEGVHVVVLSEELADRAFITDSALIIGAVSVNAEGEPIMAGAAGKITTVSFDASVKTTNADAAPSLTPAQAKVALDEWTAAPSSDYADGTCPRYASIKGPADLTSLGASQGYGWYRIAFNSASARRVKVMMPESADRLHVMLDAEPVEVVGVGPGASDSVTLQLRKDDHVLTVLADNMGRFCEGADIGEKKGLFGEIWEVKPVRAGKARIEVAEPIDLLAFRKPLWAVADADATLPERLTWRIMHRRQSPIIVSIDPLGVKAVLVLNDEPVRFIDPGARHQLLFDKDALRRGANVFQVAVLPESVPDGIGPLANELTKRVNFMEGVADFTNGKGKWSFAKWEPAAPAAYRSVPKSGLPGRKGPTWWQSSFIPIETDAPLVLDLTGMTKGQAYINKRHLGRYWVATADRKVVGPQTTFIIPPSWVEPDESNEIVLFDEHAGNPSRVKLAYDTSSVPIRA